MWKYIIISFKEFIYVSKYIKIFFQVQAYITLNTYQQLLKKNLMIKYCYNIYCDYSKDYNIPLVEDKKLK